MRITYKNFGAMLVCLRELERGQKTYRRAEKLKSFSSQLCVKVLKTYIKVRLKDKNIGNLR